MRGFLAGVGTGYAIAVLFAPKSGKEARKDLSTKAEELRNFAGQQISRLKEAAGDPQQLVQQVKEQAKPYVDQAQQAIGNAATRLKDTAKAVPTKASISALLMLNTASREDLMGVYGIGPVLADKIIKARPYTSDREVVDRNIIPESAFKELTRSLKSA